MWVPPEGFILKKVGKFVGGGEEVRQMEGVGDTYDARNGCRLLGGSPF